MERIFMDAEKVLAVLNTNAQFFLLTKKGGECVEVDGIRIKVARDHLKGGLLAFCPDKVRHFTWDNARKCWTNGSLCRAG